jgi:hypothetical protein
VLSGTSGQRSGDSKDVFLVVKGAFVAMSALGSSLTLNVDKC